MDQHTVTRAYLEAFVDPVTPARHEPSVWVTRLREATVKRRAPHNVAVLVDYYSRTLASGEVDDSLEQMLAAVESDAAPVLRGIRGGRFTLTDDERECLAIFVGFMLVRVPSFRKYLEQAASRFGESLMRAAARRPEDFERRFRDRGLNADQIPQMRHLWLNAGNPAEGFTLEAPPDLSLGYAFTAALAPVRFLLKMRWQFLVSKGEPLITGDTPVTKTNHRVRPPLTPGLIDQNTEVTFPIGPSVCFRAWWKRDQPPVVDIGDDEVARLNRERVRFADQEVFASSEAGAQGALRVYAELQQRGEAHAKAIRLMLSEGGGPPKLI